MRVEYRTAPEPETIRAIEEFVHSLPSARLVWERAREQQTTSDEPQLSDEEQEIDEQST